MLSIGEIAHSTGVSRRMLRHWEQLGLIEPARVDPATGYRGYDPTQTGRVNAVAALRDLGFGLDDIKVMLHPRVEKTTLEGVLRAQEQALERQISEASTRLAHVRERLDLLETKARVIQMNLVHQALPALRLTGVQTTVRDEADIPAAVSALRKQLENTAGAPPSVLIFDGTDPDTIVVTAGAERALDALHQVAVPAVENGISIQFDEPTDVADAWVVIDSHLEQKGMRTSGIYRQLVAADGSMTLQAEVRPRA